KYHYHAESSTKLPSTSTYSTSEEAFPSYNPALPIIAGVLVISVFVVIAIYIYYQIRVKKILANSISLESVKDHDEMLIPRLKNVLRERTAGDDIDINENRNKLLGGGSFGKVYLAEYRSQKVAVKVFERKAFKWFERERKIYSFTFMNHDLILRFLFAGKYSLLRYNKVIDSRDTHIIVTDFCEVGSLYKLLCDGQIFNVSKGLSLCTDLVNGVDYLHSGLESRYCHRPAIAHRDLKSSNIFVKKRGESHFTLVIGDFGFAITDCHLPKSENPSPDSSSAANDKNVISPATTSGNITALNGVCKEHKVNFVPDHTSTGFSNDMIIVGTVRYNPPELFLQTLKCNRFEAFKQADIYSMALILWEIRSRTLVENQALEISLFFIDLICYFTEDSYALPYINEEQNERRRVELENLRIAHAALIMRKRVQKLQTIVEQQCEDPNQNDAMLQNQLSASDTTSKLLAKREKMKRECKLVYNQRIFLKKFIAEIMGRPKFPANKNNKYLVRLERLICQCWLHNPESRPSAAYCKKEMYRLMAENSVNIPKSNLESSTSLNNVISFHNDRGSIKLSSEISLKTVP
uniref:receptor protein serine/threonine kinase n=1 Tax=Romanomermis culicivorax TaxID=13658 RepID=A0A915J089_ROMCU